MYYFYSPHIKNAFFLLALKLKIFNIKILRPTITFIFGHAIFLLTVHVFNYYLSVFCFFLDFTSLGWVIFAAAC